MNRTPWSQDDFDLLKSMCAKGYSRERMAKMLCRSTPSVVGKMAREGLTLPVEAVNRNKAESSQQRQTNPVRDKARREKIRASFTPERLEQCRASAQRLNSEHPAGSRIRRVVGDKLVARSMAWCPDQYRDEYRILRRKWNVTAAEARRRILAKLSPFERQMLAIQQGRGIVSRPNLSKTYDYTLAGGSPL
jgi:hypothetical protein